MLDAGLLSIGGCELAVRGPHTAAALNRGSSTAWVHAGPACVHGVFKDLHGREQLMCHSPHGLMNITVFHHNWISPQLDFLSSTIAFFMFVPLPYFSTPFPKDCT